MTTNHPVADPSENPSPARAVTALDNIQVDLPTAGLGSRVLAVLVDYLLVGILQVVALGVAFALATSFDWGTAAILSALIVVVFLIDWGYFAGLEVLLRGRTPGKAAVGLRVVGRTGAAAPLSALLARNLLRLPDMLVGVPMIALDPLDRRLGDRFAGTLVVQDSEPTPEIELRRVPADWSAREVAVAEALLERADQMDPGQRDYLARRLLNLIAEQAPELVEPEAAGADPLMALRRSLGVDEA